MGDSRHASGMPGIRRHNFHFRLTFQKVNKNFCIGLRARPDGRLRQSRRLRRGIRQLKAGSHGAGRVWIFRPLPGSIIVMVVVMLMVVLAVAIMMAPVAIKFFAVDRLWAVIHRWWCVGMALAFVHHDFALWFAPVIRTECCPGRATNRGTHNGAIATIQVMANHGTQCPT